MGETLEQFLNERALLRVEKTGKPTQRDLQVSTAVLLVHMANIDDSLTSEEIDSICSTLNREFGLTDAESGQIMEVADFLRRDKGKITEFVKLVSERFEKSQKVTIVAMLWRVMTADGLVSRLEANVAASVADTLGLSSGDIDTAKSLVQSGEV